MKIVLTGAFGFIGQHFLDMMAERQGVHVNVITRRENPSPWCRLPSYTLFHGDLSKELPADAFRDADVLVNFAAELKDPLKFKAVNVQGTEKLVELSKKNGIKRIIHLSSVGVVGMQHAFRPVPVNEYTDCNPHNGYEETKLASEKIFQSAFTHPEDTLTVLRPTNVFGEHHPRHALLNFFQRVNAEKIFVYAKGALVNYVYVKDVAAAVLHFLDKPRKGTFNVGRSMTFDKFLSLSAEACGKEGRVARLPAFLFRCIPPVKESVRLKRNALSNYVTYNDEALRASFTYPFGTAEGIKRTVKYYTEKGLLE